ncbi:MbcA/ParS/Xre antitoxin family protein [Dyella sp.]|uniref:MbcA/ParS/Xre antitoxin family protein n=1 Tax=Dyella sp. TaxID=1869338 RepID=UPI0039C8AA91
MYPAIHTPAAGVMDQPVEALGGPALRAFFRLADSWNLRIADQRKLLGGPAESTFYKWKREQDGTPGRDVIERISYLLGIYKSLHILFSDPRQADEWVHRPNSAALFHGQSAMERMLSGNVSDLYVVRQYLDAQRGWN